MGTPNWNDGNDNWETASDWSTGAVPAAGDDVKIAEGNPQLSTDVGTVASLTISANQTAPNVGLSLTNDGNLATTGCLNNNGTLTLSVFPDATESSTAEIDIMGVFANTGATFIEAEQAGFESRDVPTAEITADGLSNSGSISVTGNPGTLEASVALAVLNVAGQLTNNGTVTTNNAAQISIHGAISGSGFFFLNSNSQIEMGSADSNNVEFGPANPPSPLTPSLHSSTLKLDAPSQFSGVISGFGNNDTVDLTNEIVTNVSYAGSTATVTLANGSTQTFTITGDLTGLTHVSDGNGGTDILLCFAGGTQIATARGDVAVEDLQEGDFAVTSAGALRPITWIGSRVIESSAQPTPSALWPVRIRAGAFGGGLPFRDLFLSPGHPVLVGDHLVPIMCLINGTTIDRVPVERVTYWHIELDEHDILLAEGLPAESYLDWGDRAFFTEGTDHALTNPDFVVTGLAGRCRPVAIDGPVVEAERRRLDAVFDISLSAQCAWPSVGDITLL